MPKPSDGARSRALHRSLLALQLPGTGEPAQTGAPLFPRSWHWALVLGVLAVTSTLWLFHRPGDTEDVVGDRQILRQMEKLFSNQVDSIVVRNGKIDLSIAEGPVVGINQPVLLVFKRSGENIRVLSYSGHHICLTLGKTRDCFEILETPSGDVILEADNRVWLGSSHPIVAGYSLHAQTLEAPL
jgi:hypothetical protein